MTRETANLLWGDDAVKAALAEPPSVSLSSSERADLVRRAHELGPGGLRSWALRLPWPAFCAVVRLVSGRESEMLLSGE